jgi:hypothetical protein
MVIKNIVVFKTGSHPPDEMWYLRQVLESIGLSLSALEGAYLDIRYVNASNLNQPYLVGFARQSTNTWDWDRLFCKPEPALSLVHFTR